MAMASQALTEAVFAGRIFERRVSGNLDDWEVPKAVKSASRQQTFSDVTGSERAPAIALRCLG